MRIHRLLLSLAVVSLVATSSAQPRSFEIVFEPSSLTLIPGEPPQAVEIRLTRHSFAGPVTLSWEGGDHRVSRTGDADRFVPLEKSKRIELSAAASASPGMMTYTVKAKGTRLLDMRAGAEGDSDPGDAPDLEMEFKLPITIAARPAASLRVEPDSLQLLVGQAQRLTIHVVGKNGYSGPVVVRGASSSAEVNPPLKELASLPASFDATVLLRAPIPAGQAANDVHWRVEGPKQPNTILAEASTALSYQIPILAPAFELTTSTRMATLEGISTTNPVPVQTTVEVSAVGGAGWNGRLQVTASADALLQVQPSSFELDTANPSDRSTTLTLTLPATTSPLLPGGAQRNQVVLRVQATAEGGPAKTLTIPVLLRYAPSASIPPPPFEDLPVVTGIPPQMTAEAVRVSAANAHLDGLAQALQRGNAVIDPKMAEEQLGFASLYETLIAELQNPVNLTENGEIDPAVLTAMIEQSEVLRRHAEVVQIASLATPSPVLFQLEQGFGLGKVHPWQSYKPVEMLIMELRLRRAASVIQPGTERMRALLGNIDSYVEKIGESLEKAGGDNPSEKIKKAQKALKAYAVASAAITIADLAGKAVLAYMPGQITSFYTVINGKAREENDPPVELEIGQTADVKVMIKTKSLGGQITTPSEVAGWIWSNIPEKEKKKAGLTPADEQKMKFGIEKETKALIDKVWARVTKSAQVKQWIDALNKSWDIRAFDNRPVECNSTNVIDINTRSENLLRVFESSTGKGSRWSIIGVNETKPNETAGYDFSLRESIFNDLKDAAAPGVRLWQVKAVVTIKKKKEEEKPKKPCPTGACKILDLNGAVDDRKRGTDWSCSWAPEAGGGFIGSVPGADCACACILPH